MKKIFFTWLACIFFAFFTNTMIFAQTLDLKEKAEKYIDKLYLANIILIQYQLENVQEKIKNFEEMERYKNLILILSKKSNIASYEEITKLNSKERIILQRSLQNYCTDININSFLTENLESLGQTSKGIYFLIAMYKKYIKTGDEKLLEKIKNYKELEEERLEKDHLKLEEMKRNIECKQPLNKIFNEIIKEKAGKESI